MSNQIPNIAIAASTITDIYADAGVIAAGISAGDKIKVSVIGQGSAKIYFGEFAPSVVNNDTGYHEVRPRLPQCSRPDDKGAFIYSMLGCTISIRFENDSISKNGGVPEDVTRRFRVEGHNPSLSGGNIWHDIWEGGANIIPEPSQAGQQLQVLSSNVGDTLLGTGAQIVRLDYLNTLDELVSELIELDGTTPVLTDATNITDVVDLYNVSVGANDVSLGNVDITEPANALLIYNRIGLGNNKSMSTLRHALPSTTFYLTQLTVSGDTKGTDVMLRSNSNDSGDVFGDNNWLFQVPITMADSPTTINFNPSIEIPPTARLKVSARGTNAGNSVSVFINGWVKV